MQPTFDGKADVGVAITRIVFHQTIKN